MSVILSYNLAISALICGCLQFTLVMLAWNKSRMLWDLLTPQLFTNYTGFCGSICMRKPHLPSSLASSQRLSVVYQRRTLSDSNEKDDTERRRQPVAALAHVEKVKFLRPVKCDQLMHVQTEVIYTSLHSLRTLVSVYATDTTAAAGGYLACSSWLWYVPADVGDDNKVMEVPSLHTVDKELWDEGKLAYNALKSERQKRPKQTHYVTSKELFGNSDYLITGTHCGRQSTCRGGAIMKWMDECAGVAAIQYCGRLMITASIDSMRFYSTVQIGSVLSVVSRPVFASERSIDMYTVVYEQQFDLGDSDTVVYQIIADAFLTFVPFIQSGSVRDSVKIPEVVPVSDEDTAMYEARRKLCIERKESTS